MGTQLVYDTDRLVAFVRAYMPFARSEGQVGIGLERAGKLQAAVIYEGINPFNVWMSVAARPGAHWLTRTFLRVGFGYAFVTCGARAVRAYVDASNTRARALDEHLGFQVEAVLQGAAKDGGDVLIYRMLREDCRYVTLPPT